MEFPFYYNYNNYYYYKPFYAFDRFKRRDVYFSLWGNLLVHSYLRFQATDFHIFRLVGKALACKWFLAQLKPRNRSLAYADCKKRSWKGLIIRFLKHISREHCPFPYNAKSRRLRFPSFSSSRSYLIFMSLDVTKSSI
jgi:hypothetical protein